MLTQQADDRGGFTGGFRMDHYQGGRLRIAREHVRGGQIALQRIIGCVFGSDDAPDLIEQ
jgi:hypothetical protein